MTLPTRISSISLAVAATAALAFAACDDTTASEGTGGADVGIDGGVSGDTDAMAVDDFDVGPVEPDSSSPDMNVVTPDAADSDPDAAPPASDTAPPESDVAPVEPDAVVPDAELPPIDAGAMCEPDDPEACDPWYGCVDGACRPDLSGLVFRMSDARVIEPEIAAASLEVALQLAIAGGYLSLLFEPSGYNDDGSYRLYIGSGNGDQDNDGRPDGTFGYRHNLPVQNIDGAWFDDGEGDPRFTENGESVFGIYVPSSWVDIVNDDGEDERIRCFTPIEPIAQVEAWPVVNADTGLTQLAGHAVGFLPAEEALGVEFEIAGSMIRLADILDGPPDQDINGDGENDAYSFHIEVLADQIAFEDANPARDPNPSQHELCP